MTARESAELVKLRHDRVEAEQTYDQFQADMAAAASPRSRTLLLAGSTTHRSHGVGDEGGGGGRRRMGGEESHHDESRQKRGLASALGAGVSHSLWGEQPSRLGGDKGFKEEQFERAVLGGGVTDSSRALLLGVSANLQVDADGKLSARQEGVLGIKLKRGLPHTVESIGVVLDLKCVAQGQPGYGNPHVNPGDLVLKMDGVGVTALSSDEIHKLLGGEVRSVVRLMMQRHDTGETYTIQVVLCLFRAPRGGCYGSSCSQPMRQGVGADARR